MRPGVQNLPLGCYLPHRCHSWKHVKFCPLWGLCQHPEQGPLDGRGQDEVWMCAQQLLQVPEHKKGGFWSPEGPSRILGFMNPEESQRTRSPQHPCSSGKMQSIEDPQRRPIWPRFCKSLSQPCPASSPGRQIAKTARRCSWMCCLCPGRCDATVDPSLFITVQSSWQDLSQQAEILKSFRIHMGSQTLLHFLYDVNMGVLS